MSSCSAQPVTAAPKAPIKVNGAVISRAMISREVQNHPASSPAAAWKAAALALVIREALSQEVVRLGIEAEATPRQARGVVRKMPKAAIAGMERRGVDPRVRQRERQAAEHEARAPKPAQPRDWSRDIQARQDSIRRAYLDHANALERGDAADRRLARDIRRFVADMPVALTRRQALAVELRRVLDQRHGKAVPVGVSSDPTPPDKGWYRASPAFALGPAKWPRR